MRIQKITILTICLGTFLAGIIITPVAFAETYTVINAQESFQRGCEETTNACFDPSLITIRVGDMIIWENVDSQGHNVANGFDLSSDDVGKVFDSDFIDPGASFSHTFNVVGTYDYFCMIHPWMKGTVIVEKTEPVAELESEQDVEIEPEVIETVVETEAESEQVQQPSGGCGPGTVLIDGVCELAPTQQPTQQSSQGCGPGTVMVDGICELDEKTESSSMSIEPLYIIIAVVAIGGIIGAIFVVRKGSKTPNPAQQESVTREHIKTSTETKESAEFCQSCGASLKPGARFCGKCGTPC